jgi:D-alanine-D-alanine ligase
MRILVIHNADFNVVPDPNDKDDEGLCARAEVAEVAAAVAVALNEYKHEVQIEGIQTIAEMVDAIRRFNPDVVFNLCESLAGDARYEPSIAAQLEEMNVVFTGNGSRALRLCLDKQTCNETLVRADVPVPESFLLTSLSSLPTELRFPLIVKPNAEDGSTGIHGSSVVDGLEQLASEFNRVQQTLGGSVIAQRYIDGREINVSLLGSRSMRVLPLAEIDFTEMPQGMPHIVSYAAKWADESAESRGTRVRDCKLDPDSEKRLTDVVLKTASHLGLCGYARVDCRIDNAGNPWVIDVNPNCTIAPNAGFARAAGRAGFSYPEIVNRIVLLALERHTT